MRISAAILPVLVSTAVLLSCGPPQPSTEVDPTLGRSCFEAHQDTLPPGSQYEGIAEASENRITIRAMTGIKVEQLNCSLASDGTVRALAD